MPPSTARDWPPDTQIWLARIGNFWHAKVAVPGGRHFSGADHDYGRAIEAARSEYESSLSGDRPRLDSTKPETA